MDLLNNLTAVQNLVSEYLTLKLQLVKLSVLEKMSKIGIFLTSLVIIILAATIFFIFAAAAFVVWYGAHNQDYLTGLLIVMGAVIFLMILFLSFRRKILESFFTRTFSSILFEKDDDE